MTRLSAILLTLAAGTAVARDLPLDATHWDDVNPLGGDFANGRYVCRYAGAQWRLAAKGVPKCSNVTVSATFTPTASDGDSWKTAAVAIWQSSRRFWHLALLETPQPRAQHTYELNEMRDGTWLAQHDLKVEADEVKAPWRFGETYRLTIEANGTSLEGRVTTADGRLVFRRRYRLAPQAVGCGAPALKGYDLRGEYGSVSAEWHGEVACAATSDPAERAASAQGPFWRIAQDAEGRWNFVSPEGKVDFLAGCSSVNWSGDYNFKLGYAPYGRTVRKKYGTPAKWAAACAARLRDWGFSYATGSSEFSNGTDFSYSRIIGLGQSMANGDGEFSILPCDGGPCTAFPNVFSPKWEAYCRFRAREVCRPCRNDRRLVGWFIDNELSWWGDLRQFRTPPARGLYDAALKRPAGHSARAAAEAFARAHGFDDPAKADLKTCRAFVALCAERYFSIAAKAIREADPNHLVLGCRFAGIKSSDPVVWEACGRHCDVLSVNLYPVADLTRKAVYNGGGLTAPLVEDLLGDVHKRAGKPLMITEWSFSALDSGLPCLHGAGQRFMTQGERAEAVGLFARTMYALPYMAGYLFFKWSDQPYYGRKSENSENTNYGLVNANGEPYAEVTSVLAEIQRNGPKWRHAAPPRGIAPVRLSAEEHARKACRGGAKAAEFVRGEDGSFVLDNGSLRLAGREGEAFVSVGENAVYSVMVRQCKSSGQYDWIVASRLVSAKGEVREGVACADLVFSDDQRRFHVTERLYLPAGSPFFVAEHKAVENVSSREWTFDQIFFRLLPRDKREARLVRDFFITPDGQPTPIPPSLWRPWQFGAWITPGAYCGVAAPREAKVSVHYWKDANMHTDAVYSLGRKVTLKPNESLPLTPAPYVLGAAAAGTEADWVKAFAEMRTLTAGELRHQGGGIKTPGAYGTLCGGRRMRPRRVRTGAPRALKSVPAQRGDRAEKAAERRKHLEGSCFGVVAQGVNLVRALHRDDRKRVVEKEEVARPTARQG